MDAVDTRACRRNSNGPFTSDQTMERRRIWFSGRVQGVGFRYTTAAIARRYPITGYVQNLNDGRVVVEAEGSASELDRFLADLEGTMRSYIRERRVETLPHTGEFEDFHVEFSH